MRAPFLVTAATFIALGACGGPQTGTDPEAAAPSPSRAPVEKSSPEGSKDKARTPQPAPENPAPDVSFETFDGDVFALAEQRGTPVVLNFWESW